MLITAEEYRQLKEELKKELIEEGYKTRVVYAPLKEIERKYHDQLTSINGGQIWANVSRVIAYMHGVKYIRLIPEDEIEMAKEEAKNLCEVIIKAFKNR